jgi:hypothetical protein
MKKLNVLLTLIIVLLFVNNTIAQEIPNNSFETWSVAAEGHEDPDSWSTANSTTNVSPLFITTTDKTDDAYDGSFAAKLTSQAVFTFVAPGFVTLGDFEIDIWTQVTSITGGIDFYLYPDNINLYYKYSPASGDSFRIGMWMLRDDGNEVPDTVATALYDGFDEQTEYTLLSIDVEYRNGFEPEILNILGVSSNPDNPVEGSILYIDKFELEYSTSLIEENVKSELSFANPVSEIIIINDYFMNAEIKIFNINGSLVKTQLLSSSNCVFVGDLDSGIYILSIYKSGMTHTQKFVKE